MNQEYRENQGPTLSPETWPFEGELPNIVSYDEILGNRSPGEGPRGTEPPPSLEEGNGKGGSSTSDETPTEL